MSTPKRVQISRTKAEWKVIEQKINKKTFKVYLRAELRKIVDKYGECPLCITCADGSRLKKDVFIDTETYTTLKDIATRMKRPVASVIDEFIIAPLLMP